MFNVLIHLEAIVDLDRNRINRFATADIAGVLQPSGLSKRNAHEGPGGPISRCNQGRGQKNAKGPHSTLEGLKNRHRKMYKGKPETHTLTRLYTSIWVCFFFFLLQDR